MLSRADEESSEAGGDSAATAWILPEGDENGDRLLQQGGRDDIRGVPGGEAYPGHAAMLPLMCCVATPLQLHPRRWASSPSPAAAAPPHAESSLRVARTRLNPSSRRRRLTHRAACLHRWEERTSGGVVAEERKKEGGKKKEKRKEKGK
jgi:hypothetical protein